MQTEIAFILTLGAAVACVVVWAYRTFQTKDEAAKERQAVSEQDKAMWQKFDKVNETLSRHGEVLFEIKGRLESLKIEPKG